MDKDAHIDPITQEEMLSLYEKSGYQMGWQDPRAVFEPTPLKEEGKTWSHTATEFFTYPIDPLISGGSGGGGIALGTTGADTVPRVFHKAQMESLNAKWMMVLDAILQVLPLEDREKLLKNIKAVGLI